MEQELYALTDGKIVYDVRLFTPIEAMIANAVYDDGESGLHWEKLGEEE